MFTKMPMNKVYSQNVIILDSLLYDVFAQNTINSIPRISIVNKSINKIVFIFLSLLVLMYNIELTINMIRHIIGYTILIPPKLVINDFQLTIYCI